jgi:hypothetical protein
MCDDSPIERRYWMRRVEQLRKEMEREDLERQRKAAAPATPAKPGTGTKEPEPLPA